MSYETLRLEKRGPIAHVRLCRPEKRNALDTRALEEIREVFGELQTSFDTPVVILSGEGTSFCAGADRKNPPAAESARSHSARERRWASQIGRRAIEAIENCEAITIASIQGHAIGGGFLLAAACDFRIAARSALFHIPEVDLGIPLTWGGVPRLAHLPGYGPRKGMDPALRALRCGNRRAVRLPEPGRRRRRTRGDGGRLGVPSCGQARLGTAHEQDPIPWLRAHGSPG